MLLTNDCCKVDVSKLTVALIILISSSLARAESTEAKEAKKVGQVVTALKRHNRCESIVLSSNNLSTVFWLHRGQIEQTQPFWSSESRSKLSKMVKNLKLNHKVVDLNLPTHSQFETDPFKTSQLVNKTTMDVVNEFKWTGKLDCRKNAYVPKLQLLLDLFGHSEMQAEAQGEFAGSRKQKEATAVSAAPATDENLVADSLIAALKKKNANGNCKSFLVESNNLTSVLWIEDARLVSGGFLWGQDAREKLRSGIKNLNVVQKKLARDLPSVQRYAKDPIRSSQIFEKELQDAFREAKEGQSFRCGLPFS